jgi:transcriptional antiterminator Rof (Rho-off)
MRRRALLAALTAVSGCSGLTGVDETQTPESDATPASTATSSDLPYRGDGSAREIEPRGFHVRNRTDRERYVTVVVEHDGETLFVESDEIPADSDTGAKPYENLVAAAGIYRVIVETGDGGRAVHDWVVTPESRNLTVVLDDGFVWTSQRLVCDPLCGPVSLRGEAIGSLPQQVSETDADGRRQFRQVVSNVILTNSGTEARVVRVAAEVDGETLVDYRYDVRPGLDVIVPIMNATGVVDLTLEAHGTAAQYEWHVPDERFVFSDVADGPGANCRLPPQYRDETDQEGVVLDRVFNLADEPHTVSVSARTEAEHREDAQYDLEAESDRTVGDQWRVTEPLTLELELETGERLSATWNVCPSRSRTYSVGVDPDGTLALLRWGRPVVTSGAWNESETATWTGDEETSTPAGDEETPTPDPTATPTPNS